MIKTDKLSIKKKVALSIFALKKSVLAKAHDLQYLFWECTLKCNLSCLHCGSDCLAKSDTPDMPIDDFINVLKIIKNHTNPTNIMIAITGGEPLMRKDLAEAGSKITELGFPWGMVTNGYLMTPEKFTELLRAGLKSITISLDGLEEEHDWLRGKKGTYGNTLNAVKMAAKANEAGLVFDVVTCVNQRNIKQLEEIKKLLIDSGVKRWRTVTIFPKGRAATDDELKLNSEQMNYLMNFIKMTRDEGIIIADYGCEGFLGGWELEVRNKPFFCQAGILVGSVLADGSISACPSLRADYIQGNIYKDNFMDVWENQFQVMRNRNWLKTGECKDCKEWKYCKGNGLHLRDEKTGEILSCDYNTLRGLSN